MVCASRLYVAMGMSIDGHRNQTLHLLLSWPRCDTPLQDSVDQTVKLTHKRYRNAHCGSGQAAWWSRGVNQRMAFKVEASRLHLEGMLVLDVYGRGNAFGLRDTALGPCILDIDIDEDAQK